MSWHATFKDVDGRNPDLAIEKAESEYSQQQIESSEEHKDQFRIARIMVETILKSGVVGPDSKKYYVSMGGHANPQFNGMGTALNISVSQQEKPREAEDTVYDGAAIQKAFHG